MAEGHFLKYRFPVIICALAIFVLSSIAVPREVEFGICPDKIFHFIAYAVLSFLLFRAFYNMGVDISQLVSGVRAFGTAFIYGVLIEIYQLFLPHRGLEIPDILCNAAGALSGVLFFCLKGKR
ncbi:MAG: VanZ family protein [Candidatus Omnitrophota bacterium]|jgi:VanZ family protein